MKMKCNTCANERYCYDGNHQLTRDCCADNGFTAYTPITKADRIRAMTDDELAKYINEISNGDCPTVGDCPEGVRENETCTPWQCWLFWLKSPVEVDE